MGTQAAAADLRTARELFEEGHLRRATEACARALAEDPENYEAEHLTVRIMIERGQLQFALLPLQRLVARRPRDPGLRATLATANRVAGEPDAAQIAVEQALQLDPRHAGARIELCALLLERGEHDRAIEAAQALAAEEAANGEAALTLARALLAAGRDEDARRAFEAAVALDPRMGQRLLRLVYGYRALGDEARARRTLEEGVRLQPADPELAHLLAAARGDARGERVPDAYVVQYFDQFAEVFDKRLQDDLHYAVPEQLVQRLEGIAGEPSGTLDVLDAGCGTGLCGPLLRPLARRLVGVDLSPGMLACASDRAVYDELHEAELTAYLREQPAAFDAFVAADVLMYFADLAEVVGPAAESVRPGGFVAFSVERTEGARVLGPSGRWAHPPEEVRAVSAAAGLAVELEETVLRQEGGRPVAGLLAVGTRQAP